MEGEKVRAMKPTRPMAATAALPTKAAVASD
jgi:hypothetical protein